MDRGGARTSAAAAGEHEVEFDYRPASFRYGLIGSAAGLALLLGLVVFLYERRRERELIKRLRVIELMNHHVRNALQPVMYIPYSQDQQQQLNTIRDAVNRIDWALREILPGAPQEDSSPPRQSAA